MYSIDGIPLHNPAYSWRIKAAAVPVAGGGASSVTAPGTPQSHALIDFNASGRDGTIQVRGYVSTPVITFVVTTGGTWLEGLRRLFRLGSTLTVTADGSRQATVELVALTVDTIHLVGDGFYQVTAVLRLPNVWWRDVQEATYGPTTITTSGQQVTVFGPSTAPIRDALISVGGAITGLTVQAGYGTYFGYPPQIPAGTFLTFDAKSGRAWTGSVAFAETTEVTGNITNGPGPYYLELVQVSSDPAQTGCPVIVTGSSISGASISVKGYGRYDR